MCQYCSSINTVLYKKKRVCLKFLMRIKYPVFGYFNKVEKLGETIFYRKYFYLHNNYLKIWVGGKDGYFVEQKHSLLNFINNPIYGFYNKYNIIISRTDFRTESDWKGNTFICI